MIDTNNVTFDAKSTSINNKSFWAAKLSNGHIVYEDVRPKNETAWKRFRSFMEKNKNLKIQKICLTFGGYRVKLDLDNSDGVFLSNRIFAVLGGLQKTARCIGVVKDLKANVVSIFEDGRQTNEIVDCMVDDPRVILNA